jgi:hypothetical protein
VLGCGVGIREGNSQTEILHLIRGKNIFEVMSHGGFSGFIDLGLQLDSVSKVAYEQLPVDSPLRQAS